LAGLASGAISTLEASGATGSPSAESGCTPKRAPPPAVNTAAPAAGTQASKVSAITAPSVPRNARARRDVEELNVRPATHP